MKATQQIPDHLWRILPAKATYLRNILQYAGYETLESILKLSEDGELESVFDFMKSISDIVENKEEIFGIFHKNPQKLALLPGLKVRHVAKNFNTVKLLMG